MVATRHHPHEYPPISSSTANPAVSTRKGSPAAPGHWTHVPSKVVILWLLFSIPLVIWDTGYVLLRPHSMPGGALHKVWAPYALYGTVDYIYGWPAFKARNGFTSAQGSLNVVETLCYLFYLRIVWTHGKSIGARGRLENPKRSVAWFLFEEKHVDGRMGAIALLAVFSASVMTLSKTILYACGFAPIISSINVSLTWKVNEGLNEVFSGFDNVGHNTLLDLVLLWIIPNGLWIVFPSIATYSLGSEIIDALETASGITQSPADNSRKVKSY